MNRRYALVRSRTIRPVQGSNAGLHPGVGTRRNQLQIAEHGFRTLCRVLSEQADSVPLLRTICRQQG